MNIIKSRLSMWRYVSVHSWIHFPFVDHLLDACSADWSLFSKKETLIAGETYDQESPGPTSSTNNQPQTPAQVSYLSQTSTFWFDHSPHHVTSHGASVATHTLAQGCKDGYYHLHSSQKTSPHFSKLWVLLSCKFLGCAPSVRWIAFKNLMVNCMCPLCLQLHTCCLKFITS